jgi:hypothetical protein
MQLRAPDCCVTRALVSSWLLLVMLLVSGLSSTGGGYFKDYGYCRVSVGITFGGPQSDQPPLPSSGPAGGTGAQQ